MKAFALALIAFAASTALARSCTPGSLYCGHVLLDYSESPRTN